MLKSLLIGVLRIYQVALSPLIPPACRFYPTCSHYAAQAIERRGVRFTLRSEERPRKRKSKRVPKLAAVDRMVLAGEWTWSSGAGGLRLQRKPAR